MGLAFSFCKAGVILLPKLDKDSVKKKIVLQILFVKWIFKIVNKKQQIHSSSI